MLISKDGTTAGLTQLFKRWLTPVLFDPASRHDHNEPRMYRFASMRDIRVHLACNVLKDPDYFSQPPREMSDSTTANTRISENLRPRHRPAEEESEPTEEYPENEVVIERVSTSSHDRGRNRLRYRVQYKGGKKMYWTDWSAMCDYDVDKDEWVITAALQTYITDNPRAYETLEKFKVEYARDVKLRLVDQPTPRQLRASGLVVNRVATWNSFAPSPSFKVCHGHHTPTTPPVLSRDPVPCAPLQPRLIPTFM